DLADDEAAVPVTEKAVSDARGVRDALWDAMVDAGAFAPHADGFRRAMVEADRLADARFAHAAAIARLANQRRTLNRDERERERVVAALKQGLAVDGAAMRIGDFSRFGTLELTRARSGAGIADTWMRVCPTCGGSGRVATLDAAGLALLRALRSGRPTGAVAVGPALAGWIEDHGTAIAAAFTEMGRVAPPFRPSEDLGPLGWRIDGSI
ncbi:MAG: hypothetical protein ACFB6R_09600, partial [Alphaproteobacteria bacterium]